jgi:hypothetical protein
MLSDAEARQLVDRWMRDPYATPSDLCRKVIYAVHADVPLYGPVAYVARNGRDSRGVEWHDAMFVRDVDIPPGTALYTERNYVSPTLKEQP